MKLASLSVGSLVFVDANILIYAFAPDPSFGRECMRLLERIELGEIVGVTSAAVVSDVAHRLMSLEACATLGWSYAGVVGRLARHPEEVVKLHRFRTSIDSLVPMGVQVLSTTLQQVQAAAEISQQTGVLSNDALVLATMQEYGITDLASHDKDFDRIPWVHRYSVD